MPDSTRLNNWSGEDTRILQVMASVLAGQNREEAAVALLEYASMREPDNAEIKQALSGTYLLLGRYAEALAMADLALAGGVPGSARLGLLLVRGQALWGLNRPEDARAAMDHYFVERGPK